MILLADADDADREATRQAIADAGFDVTAVGSVDEAREQLTGDDHVECFVTAYDLPGENGLALAETARSSEPDATCVLYTATPLAEIDTEAVGDVVLEYVPKEGEAGREELLAVLDRDAEFHNQTAYPLPDDESDRLAAVERYSRVASEAEDTLDRLAEIATELFDLDAAAIGVIDAHEQRFLATSGISFDPIVREDTVCTYAILDDGVTVVEDVRTDPRFADNEGLSSGKIRFYASAPLLAPSGHAIGTFCVYGFEPDSITTTECEQLASLAAVVMDHLDLCRRLSEPEGGDRDG